MFTSASLISTAPFEKLGHEQVFAVGSDFDDAERLHAVDARTGHDMQHVVLVLDQSPYRRETLLVLQAAVEKGAAEFVPPVRTQVTAGVEFGEHIGAVDLADAQRSGSGRSFEADRCDRAHVDTELALEADPNGFTSRSGDVEMRRVAGAVLDGEYLFGGPDAVQQHRERNSDRRCGKDVGRMVDSDVHLCETEHDDNDTRRAHTIVGGTFRSERASDRHT